MKKSLFAVMLPVTILVGCDRLTSISNEKEEDATGAYLHQIDSILNSGKLVHVDVYDMGNLKSVSFQVNKFTVSDGHFSYVTLSKTTDGYFRSTASSNLAPAEIPYMREAIDTLLANADRMTNHEERYFYISKDGVLLSSVSKNSDSWTIRIRPDMKEEDAGQSLSKSDLKELSDILTRCEEKIRKISQ